MSSAGLSRRSSHVVPWGAMTACTLFLDIDGVLHPNGTARTYLRRNVTGECIGHRILGDGLWQWSEPLIQLLNKLPDVHIVLHSSWRHEISLEDIRSHMPSALAERVVAITPTQHFGRLDSIRTYCERNRVDRFVIVDDTPGEFPRNLPELVICGEGGLGDPETLAVLRDMLNRLSS